jgi:arylsulfatase A-like enzyme
MTNIKSRLIGAVPILIYKPNSKYVVDNDWAQQIDIYPTILDMIGYDKPLEAGSVF